MKRLILAGIAIFFFTLSLFLIRSHSTSAPDYAPVSSFKSLPEVIVDIPAGSTGSDIGKLLFQAKIVKSSLL